MSSARDTVLGRIRDALALAPAPSVVVPRAYRAGRTLPDDQRLALFTDRLLDYKARVHPCTADRTTEVIGEALREHGARRIGVPPGLDARWLTGYGGEVREDHPDVSPAQLDTLDAVVTASAAGCAETGTIFLDGSPGQGRRALSLVPDLHVCVVDLSTVEAGVPEAVARLAPERPTTLISGPSATSDIELERVEGVHGPRTLVVVIRTDA
ncbi:lactate utilization protein C [Streptomyces rubiginosohelvolus]|uniref:LutC/YkgG family protein n=1 Tax=Streptomyces TaxID=1883 RepID=UPI000BEFE907|nr:lactate utilization protein C [Streptomyces sp. gb14]